MPLPFIAALLAGAASSAAAVGTAVTAAGAAVGTAVTAAGTAAAGIAAASVAAVGSTSAAAAAIAATLTISTGMLALIVAAAAVFTLGFTIYFWEKLQEERTRGFKDGQRAASREYEAKLRSQDEKFLKRITDAEKLGKLALEDRKKLAKEYFYFVGTVEGYCAKNKIEEGELVQALANHYKVIERMEIEVVNRNK